MLDAVAMEELPTVTTLECIDALLRVGFHIASSSSSVVTLMRNGRRVFVRRHHTFEPYELSLVLFTAGVGTSTFLEALRGRVSGAFMSPPTSTQAAASARSRRG